MSALSDVARTATVSASSGGTGKGVPLPIAEDLDSPVPIRVSVSTQRAGCDDDMEVVLVARRVERPGWTTADRRLRRLATRVRGIAKPSAVPSERGPVGADVAAELRLGVEREELRLVYQPEFDLVSGKVVAVEALLRWQHPERGLLGPEAFIDLAERSDLIGVLGSWVIDESIMRLAQWEAELPGLAIVMRVNVSPTELSRGTVVQQVAAALTANGVPGEAVCIEITERVEPSEHGQLAATLEKLHALGVSSALDDLGAGYSTLSLLRLLPVDAIKIDRSFVAALDTAGRSAAIIGALVGLARSLDLDIIAEGVEHPDQAAELVRLGCLRAQGNLLSEPLTAEQTLVMLRLRASSTGTGWSS